jgi:hypothetical protein
MQYKLDQIISQKLERSLREGLDSALKSCVLQAADPWLTGNRSDKQLCGNSDLNDDVKSTSLIKANKESSNTPISEMPNLTSMTKIAEASDFRPETSDFGPWSKRSVPGLHTNLDQTSSLRELQDSQGKFEAEFDRRQQSPEDIVDSGKKDIYFSFDNAFKLNNRSSQCLVNRELDEGDTPPLTRSEDDLQMIQNELYRSSEGSNHKIFIIDEIDSMHIPPLSQDLTEEHQESHPDMLIMQNPAVEENGSSEEQNAEIVNLTVEEKTVAICDFITENLILEIFTDSSRLRNKFMKASGLLKRSLQNKEKIDIGNYIDTVVMKSQSTLTGRTTAMKRLNTPIGQTDLQKLLLLSPLIPFQELRSMMLEDYDSVLDLNIYIEIEEQLMEFVYNKEDLSAFQIEQKQIYHKLMFDAFNEELDHLRVYGIGGKQPGFLTTFKKQEPVDSNGVSRLMERAREEVLRWSGCKCGVLAIEEKENINAQELEDVREEALSLQATEYVQRV